MPAKRLTQQPRRPSRSASTLPPPVAPGPALPEEMLSPHQAALHAGVSKDALALWRKAGRVHAVRIGSWFAYSKADLDRFLRERAARNDRKAG